MRRCAKSTRWHPDRTARSTFWLSVKQRQQLALPEQLLILQELLALLRLPLLSGRRVAHNQQPSRRRLLAAATIYRVLDPQSCASSLTVAPTFCGVPIQLPLSLWLLRRKVAFWSGRLKRDGFISSVMTDATLCCCNRVRDRFLR